MRFYIMWAVMLVMEVVLIYLHQFTGNDVGRSMKLLINEILNPGTVANALVIYSIMILFLAQLITIPVYFAKKRKRDNRESIKEILKCDAITKYEERSRWVAKKLNCSQRDVFHFFLARDDYYDSIGVYEYPDRFIEDREVNRDVHIDLEAMYEYIHNETKLSKELMRFLGDNKLCAEE